MSVITRRHALMLGAAALAAPAIVTHANAAVSSADGLADPREAFARTIAVLEKGMEDGLQIGAQLYVSRAGDALADFGIGEARPGVAMDPRSMMIWFSSTKPVTAMGIAKLWEDGRLDLDDPIARHWPAFGQNGKDVVTIRHALSHTGGFPRADGQYGLGGVRPEMEELLAGAELEDGWEVGRVGRYHPTAAGNALGIMVEKITGQSFSSFMRESLFDPLGMDDTWIGMSEETFRDYGERIGLMHTLQPDGTWQTAQDGELYSTFAIPHAGGRGPMSELGRFYEMLLFKGELDGVRVLTPQTVEAMVNYNVEVPTFGDPETTIPTPTGLGFIQGGPLYGEHVGPRTFGHGGSRSSLAYCDAMNGIVVACVTNGRPDARTHYARFAAINTAIYEDLGWGE